MRSRSAENLWQRRAAVVAFVNLARRGDTNFPGFIDMVLITCAALVRAPERCAQTGAGWGLRELAHAAPGRVVEFVDAHLAQFSPEALQSAIQKLPDDVKDRLTRSHTDRHGSARRARRRS